MRRRGYGRGRSRSRGRSRAQRDQRPIPAGLWCGLVLAVAVLVWAGFRVPPMPLVCVALVVGSLTAKYPVPPTGRNPMTGKPNEPDQRKVQAYQSWKALVRGLKPMEADGKKTVVSKRWKGLRRPSYWMFLPVGLATSTVTDNPLLVLLNVLASFLAVMMITSRQDSRVDARHPYNGVSMPAFWKKAPVAQRVMCGVLSGVGVLLPLTLWFLLYINLRMALALAMLMPLLIVWLFTRPVQVKPWRRVIAAQQEFDQWVNTDENMLKAYGHARVNSVKTYGNPDNPLTVMYVKPEVPGGNMMALKQGTGAIATPLYNSGYKIVFLLQVLRKAASGQEIDVKDPMDPTTVRIVYARDNDALPGIAQGQVKPALANLMCDIAYAVTGGYWGKVPPLTRAHEIADHTNGETRNAWLVQLFHPKDGGDMPQNIDVNWIGGENDPSTTLRMPVFPDIAGNFHLIADEDIRFSQKADQYTPQGVFSVNTFGEYIECSRRFVREKELWMPLVGSWLLPMPDYGQEEKDNKYTIAPEGWRLSTLPYVFDAPHTCDEYARKIAGSIGSLDPDAKDIILMRDGDDPMHGILVKTNLSAPDTLDKDTGSLTMHRTLARALAYRALLHSTPANSTFTVISATQEYNTGNKRGDHNSIWKIRVKTGNGLTVNDLRRKTADIQAQLGVSTLLWEWLEADEANMWCTSTPITDPEQAGQWKNGAHAQQQFIKLFWSDAWAKAGITDKTGKAPTVLGMHTIPSNFHLVEARFQIPGGISMDRIDASEGKFQTAGNYGYTRILPRGDEHEGDKWDMLMSKTNPMPDKVDAPWQQITSEYDTQHIPLGVDDMGNPVLWERNTTPHLIVSGGTGTGKSSAMQIAVAGMMLHGAQVILCDPSKGFVDFTQWAKPRALAFAATYPETEAAIRWAEVEMERREKICEKYGVGNINDLPDEERPPLLVIAFDEFNSYVDKVSRTMPDHGDTALANANAQVQALNISIQRTGKSLKAIATQGRSWGVHMIFGAQHLNMKDMEPIEGASIIRQSGKFVLGSGSLMGTISPTNVSAANKLQKKLVGGDGTIPRGRGIYESQDAKLSSVQSYWSGGQQVLSDVVKDVPLVNPVDITPYLPKKVETFGIVEQNEEEARKNLIESNENIITEELVDNGEIIDDE